MSFVEQAKTTAAERATTTRSRVEQVLRLSPAALALLAGVLVLAVPTMVFVIRQTWSGEQGAHGPLVLFTGVWLLWKEWPDSRPLLRTPSFRKSLALLGILLPLFIVARITQIVEVEGYLMYACLLAVLFSVIGGAAMRRLWFPLFYLTFIFPPPETLVAAITNPLKVELSRVAVSLLGFVGYPIGAEGVRIYIAQYEILVAAACSGLNSIISLTAISLFYIYIRHQAEWRYSILLIFLILPVALFSNLIRVLILILVTYYAGEAAAQGFVHEFAGIVMFAAALVTMFVLDELIRPAWDRISRGLHV
jgi:exosortase